MEVKCPCGNVKFTIPKPKLVKVVICHCKSCQRQSNSAWICSIAFRHFDVDELMRQKMDVFGGEYCASTEHTLLSVCLWCYRTIMHTVSKEKHIYVRAECLAQVPWEKAIHIFCSEAVVPPSPTSVRYRYEEGSYEEGSEQKGASSNTIKYHISSLTHTSPSLSKLPTSTPLHKSRFSSKLLGLWKKPGAVRGKDPLTTFASTDGVSPIPRGLRLSLSVNNLATIATHQKDDQVEDMLDNGELVRPSTRVSRRRSMLDLVPHDQGHGLNKLSVIAESDDNEKLPVASDEKLPVASDRKLPVASNQSVVPYTLDIKPGFPPMNNDKRASEWTRGHKHKMSEDSLFYDMLLSHVQKEPCDAPIGELLDILEHGQSASIKSASASIDHRCKRSKTSGQDSKSSTPSNTTVEPYNLGLVPGFPEYQSAKLTKPSHRTDLQNSLIEKQGPGGKASRAPIVKKNCVVDDSKKSDQLSLVDPLHVNVELANHSVVRNISMGSGFGESIDAISGSFMQPIPALEKVTQTSALIITAEHAPVSDPSTSKLESTLESLKPTNTLKVAAVSTPITAKGIVPTRSWVSGSFVDKVPITSPITPTKGSVSQISDITAAFDNYSLSSPITPQPLTLDSIRAVLAPSPSIRGDESMIRSPILSPIVNRVRSETPSPLKARNPLKFAMVKEEDEEESEEEHTIIAKGHLDHMAKHPTMDRPRVRGGPASRTSSLIAPSSSKEAIAAREGQMRSNSPVVSVFSRPVRPAPNAIATAPRAGERGSAEHKALIAEIRREVAAMKTPSKRL